jgi:hypothetical protein
MSREHFISESVLALIGEKYISVDGFHWLNGVTKPLPIGKLTANILCEWHNAAMSPLDTAADKFFSVIKSIYEDLGNNKTLSRKKLWWLISGDELELWLLKTTYGLSCSGNISTRGVKFLDVSSINTSMMRAFNGGIIFPPCGLYVIKEQDPYVKLKHLSFSLSQMTKTTRWLVCA